jgi:hypothetical protein
MRTVGRMCVAVLAVSAIACHPARSSPEPGIAQNRSAATPGDSEAPGSAAFPELGRTVAPILASIENARSLLRQDSATVAADLAFLRFRKELRDQVQEVVAGFDDRDLQADVWPAGAAAMMRLREEQRTGLRPEPEAQQRADSLVAFLMAHGIWPAHVEGDTYLFANESLLLQRLGPYLTGGMRAFLRMQAAEQRRPTAGDAALMIPLRELTERLRSAERFLDAYPEAAVWDVVQSRYRWYLAVYLSGLPNSPAFDWRTGDLHPAWRESIERYAADHAGTESGRLVLSYLEQLTASGFARNVDIDAFVSELWSGVRLVTFP